MTTQMSDEVDTVAHSSTILHLLNLHDRFANSFERWSHDHKADRDILSITLKKTALIDSSIISALRLMIPGRLLGPYIIDQTMTIEILHHEVPLKFISKNTSCQYQRPLKRLKLSSEGEENDCDVLKMDLNDSILKTNNTLCTIDKTSHGRDEMGMYIVFTLKSVSRIDMSFMTHFMLYDSFSKVKHFRFRISPAMQVFLRLYDKDDRRVISSWDIVPIYEKEGMFVSMRSVTKSNC